MFIIIIIIIIIVIIMITIIMCIITFNMIISARLARGSFRKSIFLFAPGAGSGSGLAWPPRVFCLVLVLSCLFIDWLLYCVYSLNYIFSLLY